MKTIVIFSAVFLALTVVAGAATPVSQAPPQGRVPGHVDATTGMEFVFVKGGCFPMGSNDTSETAHQPVHEVCVSDFYLGKFEVTQGQWQAVMGSNPSFNKKCGALCPVENVSWDDAQNFIKQLNMKSKKTYRLPTEAEWEYAASRSGKEPVQWPGAATLATLATFGWYKENSEGMTSPVGKKKPNALGIYDMGGNVYEWCQDWYSETYYEASPKNDPQGPPEGTYRVLRGGGKSSPEFDLRTYARGRNEPGARSASDGLRLLLPGKSTQ